MLTLAIDTALQRCSAAILRGDDTLSDCSIDLDKGHAERLAPLVARALLEGEVSIADLQRVIVTRGPGSFAGIRVGLSFARGLALGTDIEVLGVDTLLALALSVPRQGHDVAAVIAGPRGQFFGARFDKNLKPVIAAFIASGDELIDRLSAGEGSVAVVASMKQASLEWPAHWVQLDMARQVSVLRLAAFGASVSPVDFEPVPLYLRPPDAAPAKPSIFADLVP